MMRRICAFMAAGPFTSLLLAVVATASSVGAPSSSSQQHDQGEERTRNSNGEILYNGIELPDEWPPRLNLTSRTSLTTWYLQPGGHPDVVIVDVGRQLFIDEFLVDPSSTATITFHSPRLEPSPKTTTGGGGLFYDKRSGHFKNFFTCEDGRLKGDGALGALCLAISSDGLQWNNVTNAGGTHGNVVWNRSAFSRSVLLDDEADLAQRWRLLQVESPQTAVYPMFYQLYTSADGMTWSRQGTNLTRKGVGEPQDCSSALFNPFRNVTVLSSKWTNNTHLGRYRKYEEAGPAFSETAFSSAPLVDWVAADMLDPRWLGNITSGGIDHGPEHTPELYNLDAVAYESLMVGSFRIFRCKEHYAGCAVMYPKDPKCKTHPKDKGCGALSHELADILLGWSRDGFAWSRTPAAQPKGANGFQLAKDRRYPFVGQDLGGEGWNSHGIMSTAGALAIVGPDKQHESLRMFFSSTRRSLSNTGVAILRRDGFASIGSSPSHLGCQLLTVPLVFHTRKTALFVNVVGGVQRIDFLSSTGAPTPLLSMKSALPADTNSTMLEIPMQAGTVSGIAALRGQHFRLHFELAPRARLFSFWLSEDGRGHSSGWLGAGGILYPGGLRDRRLKSDEDAPALLAFAPPVHVGHTPESSDPDRFYTLPPPGLTEPGQRQLLFGENNGNVYVSTTAGDTWESVNASGENLGADGSMALVVRNGTALYRSWSLSFEAVLARKDLRRVSYSGSGAVFWGQNSTGGLSLQARDEKVVFEGLPHATFCGYIPKLKSLGGFSCPFYLLASGTATIGSAHTQPSQTAVPTTLIQTAQVYWGGGSNISGGGIQTSVVAFASYDEGLTYHFQSIIANASQYPDSYEGINENSLLLLKDNRTLLFVARLDGGDGCLPRSWPKLCAGPYRDYLKCTSTNLAKSWNCERLDGMGAARPKLTRMPLSGAVLLSGGRARNRNTSDVIVWLNSAGDGREWVKYSVSYQHNRGVVTSGSGLPTFPSDVNKTIAVCGSCGWTSSYTSLLPLQGVDDSVVIIYDRAPQIIAPSGRCVANCTVGQEMYAMKMTLIKTDDIQPFNRWLTTTILTIPMLRAGFLLIDMDTNYNGNQRFKSDDQVGTSNRWKNDGAGTSMMPSVITLAFNASSAERFAAEELAAQLFAAGCDLPLMSSENVLPLGASRIAVGYHASLSMGVERAHLDELTEQTSPDDAFRISVLRGNISLAAPFSSTRGTTNAVYSFLRACGFRFLAADETVRPILRKEGAIPRVATTTTVYSPPFNLRDTTEWAVAQDHYSAPGYFSSAARANLSQALGFDGTHAFGPIGSQVGTRSAMMPSGKPNFGFVHTAYELLSPTGSVKDCVDNRSWSTEITEPCPSVRKAHPEWFVCRGWPPQFRDVPLLSPLSPNFTDVIYPCTAEAASHPYSSHMCWSAPGVYQALADGVRRVIRADKSARYIAVDEMDGYAIPCPADMKLVQEERSFSGPLIHAVSNVAKMVAKEYSSVKIETIAYHEPESLIPPKKMKKLPHNVAVRLCDAAKVQSLGYDAPVNNQSLAYLRGWINLSSEVSIWTYMGNIDWPLAPYPNYRQVAIDIEFLAREGAAGYFAQGAAQPASDMTELKAYLIGRKTFEPLLNTNLLVDEFVEGYFGVEAAPFVRTYLDVLETAASLSPGFGVGGGGVPPSSALFGNETVLAAAWALRNATAAAAGSRVTKYHERTLRAALPIRYILLLRWAEYRAFCVEMADCSWPAQGTKRGAFEEFAQVATRAGVRLVAIPSCPSWRVTDCWNREANATGFEAWLFPQ